MWFSAHSLALYSRHAFGMGDRKEMAATSAQWSLKQWAAYPGVRHCMVKMLIGHHCGKDTIVTRCVLFAGRETVSLSAELVGGSRGHLYSVSVVTYGSRGHLYSVFSCYVWKQRPCVPCFLLCCYAWKERRFVLSSIVSYRGNGYESKEEPIGANVQG